MRKQPKQQGADVRMGGEKIFSWVPGENTYEKEGGEENLDQDWEQEKE